MSRYRLTPAEREVIITANDAGRGVLHVFTESSSALATRLLKVARAVGAVITPTGAGYEFDLPVRCLSVRIPRTSTAAQKAQLATIRARRQKGHFAFEILGATRASAPPAVRVAVDTGAEGTPVQSALVAGRPEGAAP